MYTLSPPLCLRQHFPSFQALSHAQSFHSLLTLPMIFLWRFGAQQTHEASELSSQWPGSQRGYSPAPLVHQSPLVIPMWPLCYLSACLLSDCPKMQVLQGQGSSLLCSFLCPQCRVHSLACSGNLVNTCDGITMRSMLLIGWLSDVCCGSLGSKSCWSISFAFKIYILYT